ncbi:MULTISPECIES: hypothetical protein [unclassified Prevotella]|uniref:hypothetical protein n=1 Tax=unclassified Prevotella TaxID=2638335 RepID=UPI00048BF70A|nr:MULTISPECIES: hypothetical protein [unclassified Prevotella]
MSTSLFQNAKKNPVSTIILLLFFAYVGYSIIDDIQTVRQATTDFDYCKGLCDLVEFIGKTITWCIYFVVCYLTYVHKQYSRWILWLYYLAVVVFIIYYICAGNTLDYVFNHIGAEHLDRLPSMARSLYGAPFYFIVFSFFFMPKLIKDTMKLKKEQELTV